MKIYHMRLLLMVCQYCCQILENFVQFGIHMKVYLQLGTKQDEGTESGKLGDGRAFNTWLEVERLRLACDL